MNYELSDHTLWLIYTGTMFVVFLLAACGESAARDGDRIERAGRDRRRRDEDDARRDRALERKLAEYERLTAARRPKGK